jgi:hypothetical protein
LQCECLEARLTPAAIKVFGGLEFMTQGAFTSQHHVVTTTSPVEVGVKPAKGAVFTPWLSLDGGVRFRDNDSTGTFSTSCTVSAINGSQTIALLDAHLHTFKASGLLVGGFFSLPASDSNAGHVPVAGGALTVTGLHLTRTSLELQGSIALPLLSGLAVPVQGGNFVALDRTGVHVGGLDAGISGTKTITVTGQSLNLQNGHVLYNASTNEFDLSGTAGLTFNGNTITVSLGSQQNPGLAIVNGALQSIHAAVTTPTLAIGGLTFQTLGLTLGYDKADAEFILAGSSSITLAGQKLALTLGNTLGTGLVIHGGNLVSLDGAFSVSQLAFTSAVKVDHAKLGLRYQQNPQEFFVTGSAQIALPGSGTELSVHLGGHGSPGIEIQNGQLENFDLTVTTDSEFTIDGLTIDPKSLHVSYSQASDASGTHQTFDLTGDVLFSAGPLQNVEITLGSNSTPGLEITDGALVSFDAVITADEIDLGKSVKLDKPSLSIVYQASNQEFDFAGSAQFSLPGADKELNVTVGTPISPGIVIVGGQLTNFDLAVDSDSTFTIDGLTIDPKSLRVSYSQTTDASGTHQTFDLTGDVLFSAGPLQDLEITLVSDSRPGLEITDGALVSLNASVTGTFSVANLDITAVGLGINYDASTTDLSLFGSISVTVAGNTVSVDLGTADAPGLVIVGGELKSLEATVTTPEISIAGFSFQVDELNFTYDNSEPSKNEFTLTGSSSITFHGDTLSLQLGAGPTRGIVIDNGSLTGLDATVTASEVAFGPVKIDHPSLNLVYQQKTVNTPERFAITGGAMFDLPGADHELDVQLGDATTQGLVLVNGQLQSLDFSVSTNSEFHIAGLTLDPKSLHVTYSESTDDSGNNHNTFTLTGDVAFSVGNTIKDVEIELGDDSTRTSGLVITDGVLESLDASVTADFTVAGLMVNVQSLTVRYDRSLDDFTIYGSLGVTFSGHTFSAGLGDASDPGIVIVGGELVNLNITGITGDFNLYEVDVSAVNLGIKYNTLQQRLELSGGISVYLSNGIGGEIDILKGALVIDTQTGALSIDDHDGLEFHIDVQTDNFAIHDLHVAYSMNSDGTVNISASGTVSVGNFGFGGSFTIVHGQLTEVAILYDAGQGSGIPIGNTGYFITYARGEIDNLNDTQNITATVTVTIVNGKRMKINGKEYAQLEGIGTIKVSRDELDLSGTVLVGGGYVAQGTATVKINWTTGIYDISITNGSLLDGVITFSGDMIFDNQGNLTVDGTASLTLPNDTPDFVKETVEAFNNNSDTLGSAVFRLQYSPGLDLAQDYASASILFQGNPIIGVKIDFNNNVTLIGSGAGPVSAALEQLGESAQQTGLILRDAFNAGAQDVAAYLQNAGFAADQIAGSISNAFSSLSPANIGQLLFNAGLTPTQIAEVLSNTFGQGATDVTNFFTNTLGFGLDLAVGSAQNVFALDVNTWGLILRSIGYGPTSIASAFNNGLDASVSDVRGFFSNFEGLADQDIAYLMQGAGYALGQIESYFSSLGDQIASWF